jgi:hypothetical protein
LTLPLEVESLIWLFNLSSARGAARYAVRYFSFATGRPKKTVADKL